MRRLDKEIIGKEIHKYAPELNKIVFKGKGNIGKKRMWKKYFISCNEADFKKHKLTPLKCDMFKGVKITLSCETYDLINGKKENYNKFNSIKGGMFNSIKEVKEFLDILKKDNDITNDFKKVKLYIKNDSIEYFRKISIEKIEFYHRLENKNKNIKFSKYEGLPYIHHSLEFKKVVK